MALAVESPAREDLSFRTNDDRLLGYRWHSSPDTPVVISSAVASFLFDPLPVTYDPDTGLPVPPPVEQHTITSTTPGDPAGWIDAANLAAGIVIVNVPHTVWAGYSARTGTRDVYAVGAGIQRCLARGCFVVEEGVAP